MKHCEYCTKGDAPALLDEDGISVELTGRPGKWRHAYEDAFWLCPLRNSEEDLQQERNDWKESAAAWGFDDEDGDDPSTTNATAGGEL